MRLDDAALIAKKILVGLVVMIVPLLILLGALDLTRRALTTGGREAGSSSHYR